MIVTDKIAILMATYQGERFIGEQINSLLSQTCGNWELYIHDDDSRDRTPEILSEYQSRYPDKIHVLVGAPAGGAKENFMFLLGQVNAPYIMFCDQDDVWLPDKIDLTYQAMRQSEVNTGRSTPTLVFSDLTVVDQNLHVIAERMSKYQQLDPGRTAFKDLMIQNVITGCTCMINRALQEKALNCANSGAMIMHDWWCALVAAYFGEIRFVDKPLILYRQHGDNSVGAKKITDFKYILKRLPEKRKIEDSLSNARKQIACFSKTYSVDESLLSGFAHLGEKSKLERLHFYYRNGVKKCGLLRNVGLLVWG